MPDPIGYLVPKEDAPGFVVFCKSCTEHRLGTKPIPTPIYFENIHPYAQRCDGCREKLVMGSIGWPELFT